MNISKEILLVPLYKVVQVHKGGTTISFMSKDKHIPQGYKDSSLGIIPKEWKVKRLGELGVFKNGLNYTPSENGFSYNFLGVGDFLQKNIVYADQLNQITIKEELGEEYLLKNGDIVFVRSNGSKSLVGRCVLIKTNKAKATYSGFCIRFRLNSQCTTTKYIQYLVHVGFLKRFLAYEGRGTNITNLNQNILSRLLFPLPSVNEQIEITKALSTWDLAIEKQSELIKKLTLRKRALMQKLLIGKKRLPGFSGKWKERRLGELFTERNETNRYDLPLLSITRDKGVIYQSESEKRDISNDDKSKYKRICPNDIGYNTMRMWQGRSALSQLEGIVSPAYTIVTPTEDVDVRFMAMLIQQPRIVYAFWTHSQGLVSDTLNCKYPDFSQVKVVIPQKREQIAIADMLYGFDKEIELANEKLAKLQSQKRGLMQQLLTGKKRIK